MDKPTSDKWIVMKLFFEQEVTYKLVMGWNGGYEYEPSWKTNDGITSVEYDAQTECYKFIGQHDNDNYSCHKDAYGLSHSNELGHEHLCKKYQDKIQNSIMPKETNWMTLKY
jgi:hypothetical protein